MNSLLSVQRNSMFDAAFPKAELWQKTILVLTGSGLMALASRLTLPLPWTPVPITGQTFAVLLLAAMLGARLSLATQFLYLLQGVAGLPVFSAGTTWGIGRLLGPTGGYLVGFLAVSYVVGTLADHGWGKKLLSALMMMIMGEVVLFLVAIPWLKMVLPVSWSQALGLGLLPFLPGDLFKLLLAALLLPTGWKLLRKVGFRKA